MFKNHVVALFTRAWIEINNNRPIYGKLPVALFTRAWIEMGVSLAVLADNFVALFTRAWIEITYVYNQGSISPGRPLHEGVD